MLDKAPDSRHWISYEKGWLLTWMGKNRIGLMEKLDQKITDGFRSDLPTLLRLLLSSDSQGTSFTT